MCILIRMTNTPLNSDLHSIEIEQASNCIRERWNENPVAGIVLGTGSGQIAESIQIEATIDYGDIPVFPVSTALGHKGRLVCGRFAGNPVIAMQGRFHLYEGYSFEQVTLPIQVLCNLGIQKLLVSNAAGGVNPKMASGDIMLIDSHIDLMFKTSPKITPLSTRRLLATQDISAEVNLADSVYSKSLMQLAESVARRENFVLHRGVYAGLLGPNYETRAEYRMIRKLGGDVAGMSTVPEVTIAACHRLDVLAASIVTNVAKPDVLEPTSGQEVIDAAEIAAPNLLKIFEAVV